tara:strand:- start:4 stop:729 length:726 start_codon:yes stop_codon:yes gene_type:complete
MSNSTIITIDGPSGTGKGTVCSNLAYLLGWNFLDSGALYRALALAAERNQINTEDQLGLIKLIDNLDVEFKIYSNKKTAPVFLEVLLNGETITNEIRTETCGKMASIIAPITAVRKALLVRQQGFCKEPGLIADGRDMGTVVFPDAELKIFLTASIEERAKRRFEQLKAGGISVSLRRLRMEIEERDDRDSSRQVSPLRPAEDAVVVDTTDVNVDGVIKKISALVIDKIPNLPKRAVDYLR